MPRCGVMVTLRPTAPADLSAVVAVEADPEASQWLGDTGIAWHRAALDDADQEHLLIIEGDQIVGFVVLAGLTNRHSSIELRRLVVARAAQGRGVGRQALRTAADRAFRSGAHRLWLDVKVGNDRAQALYASEGFVHEGVLRDALHEPDGSWSSLAVLSQLEADPSRSR